MLDVCNPQIMRALLAEYGFRFSKAKGQNFLTQRWVPQRIVEASEIDETCGVLEVGPGFGPLTQELCLRAGSVVALEVDTTLQPILKATVGEFDNLEILFCDALKADLPALVKEKFGDKKPLACANLPYYITSPVLTKLLESKCFDAITVMVQKEVAQRICSKPGSADYSAFTVLCNYHAQPELLFDVPASCFMPQPKVTSAVVRLKMRKEPPAQIEDEKLFFRTVRASFAMRRKTLLNGLSAAFGEFTKAELTELLENAGISPSVRGETLGMDGFAAISNAIAKRKQ
ncbi:MAG: 16S rRNA (adenine(1518)-N(6)/adenine(1519)-N(6))-dimethyltransferase RsmA [Faecousia sp.]